MQFPVMRIQSPHGLYTSLIGSDPRRQKGRDGNEFPCNGLHYIRVNLSVAAPTIFTQ